MINKIKLTVGLAFIAMGSVAASFIDYRALNPEFTTNIPSPYCVGINTNKFPPLSAFDQQFFSTNGYLLTLKTNSGSALSNYVFSIVNNQGTVIAAGTNITTVTNGRLVTISVTSTNLPGVAAGTNVLLTTNGLTTTVNGLTDTNNVNTLISTRIGPGTNNYMAKFFNRTNVTTSSVLNVATNEVDFMMRQDGVAFTNNFTNRIYGNWTSVTTNEWLEFVSGSGGNDVAHIRAKTLGLAQGRPAIYINDAWRIEPDADQLGSHTAGALAPTADNTYPLGDGTSHRVLGINMGTGQFAMSLPTSIPQVVGNDGGGYGFTLRAKSFDINTDLGQTAGFHQQNSKFTFDLTQNLIGFGVGISNTTSFLFGGGDVVAGLVQIGTNNAAAGTPQAVGIMGARATGTDHAGTDMKWVGGPSTGTGKPGDLRGQTVEPAAGSSASINTSFKDRIIVAARPVTLTESSATLVFNVALASGKFCGMRVMATTDADDGTDFQCVSETFAVAAVNKAGTVTTTVSAPAPQAILTSSGTLSTTWTAVANGNGVDVKCNAVSSLTQTTLKTRWRVDLDGDGTLVTTPQ